MVSEPVVTTFATALPESEPISALATVAGSAGAAAFEGPPGLAGPGAVDERRVAAADADPDYTVRPEPSVTVEVLRQLGG